MWETDKGENENIILLIFVFWECFNCRWVGVQDVGLNPEARAKYLASQPLLATA